MNIMMYMLYFDIVGVLVVRVFYYICVLVDRKTERCKYSFSFFVSFCFTPLITRSFASFLCLVLEWLSGKLYVVCGIDETDWWSMSGMTTLPLSLKHPARAKTSLLLFVVVPSNT
jgi:hypothetical protein